MYIGSTRDMYMHIILLYACNIHTITCAPSITSSAGSTCLSIYLIKTCTCTEYYYTQTQNNKALPLTHAQTILYTSNQATPQGTYFTYIHLCAQNYLESGQVLRPSQIINAVGSPDSRLDTHHTLLLYIYYTYSRVDLQKDTYTQTVYIQRGHELTRRRN